MRRWIIMILMTVTITTGWNSFASIWKYPGTDHALWIARDVCGLAIVWFVFWLFDRVRAFELRKRERNASLNESEIPDKKEINLYQCFVSAFLISGGWIFISTLGLLGIGTTLSGVPRQIAVLCLTISSGAITGTGFGFFVGRTLRGTIIGGILGPFGWMALFILAFAGG